MSFSLIQLTIRAIRDILLEITVEFPYIHQKHDFIINFVKISMTLFIICKFDFFFSMPLGHKNVFGRRVHLYNK